MPRKRVRREVIERASGSLRAIYESLEIDAMPRAPSSHGVLLRAAADDGFDDDEATGYVDGHAMLVGPLRRMLAALNLTIEDLE